MSSHQIVISAEPRSILSKGAIRKLRSENVPAVLYQKGGNINLSIPVKNLPAGHTGSQVVGLQLNGSTRSVLMREVQVDPLTQKAIHIDFQEVDLNEVTTTRVPVEFVGLTKEQEKECLFKALIRSMQLRGPVSKFPAKIQINVSTLKADETLQLSEEMIPAGLTIRGSRKLAVAKLTRK